MPKKKKSTRKRPAKALAPSDVHFPAAHSPDFVIHYRGTAYHVHKFVLDHHSSHFRTYIETLTDRQRAYSTDECSGHPSIEHCIRLPDSCGKVEASSDDFRLFLCHLYFAQHYCCIPYKPAADVDLTAEPPPAVTLDYSACDTEEQLRDATSSLTHANFPPAVYQAVVSLCHYFDCKAVVSRAEYNCVLMVEFMADIGATDSLWSELWSCFLLALQFDLKRVKAACVETLACHSTLVNAHKTEWESVRAQLDKDTLFELLQAAFDISHEVR